MAKDSDNERSPLLSSQRQESGVRFYTVEDVISDHDDLPRHNSTLLDSDSGARRPGGTCRSWISGGEGGESDAEYRSASRASRTLPNNAPVPFVYLGLCCAILAGLCFTSSNVMVKYIPDVNSWQLLFVRCISQNVAMVPIIVFGRHSILGTPDFATRWRVFAQGVLGGLLLLGIFEAVARLPLGDCTAIFFSAPAFTMILSCFILRDHCGVWRIIVAIMLLSGVLILSRPESLFSPSSGHNSTGHNDTNDCHHHGEHCHHNGHYYHHDDNTTHHYHYDAMDGSYDMVGLLSAVSVPFLSALIVIITRQAKHVHYSVLVFWFGVGGLVVSLIGMFGLDDGPLFHEWDDRMWMLSFMVALVGILGSILMTKAVCWVTPSKVMVVRSFEVVAAYILQVTVFDIPTHWTDLVGTMCVVSAVIAMGFEDCIMDKVNWRWL